MSITSFTIELPYEDLAEASRLEVKAMQTDDPDETDRFMRVANKLRTPSDFPVLDHPRTEQSEDLVRVVVEEFGAIAPYTPDDEGWEPLHQQQDSLGGVPSSDPNPPSNLRPGATR